MFILLEDINLDLRLCLLLINLLILTINYFGCWPLKLFIAGHYDYWPSPNFMLKCLDQKLVIRHYFFCFED